jgi:hypothetical protein
MCDSSEWLLRVVWLGNAGALFVVSMMSSHPVVRDTSTSIMFSEVTVHEI